MVACPDAWRPLDPCQRAVSWWQAWRWPSPWGWLEPPHHPCPCSPTWYDTMIMMCSMRAIVLSPRVKGCDQNTLRVQLHCKVSRHHVQCGLWTPIGIHACQIMIVCFDLVCQFNFDGYPPAHGSDTSPTLPAMEEIWMMAAFSTPIALLGCKLAALFRRGRRALVGRRKCG